MKTLHFLALLGLGTTEMLVILAIVVLLFGATKLPRLARGLGQSIKEFKTATRDAALHSSEQPASPLQKTAEDDAKARN